MNGYSERGKVHTFAYWSIVPNRAYVNDVNLRTPADLGSGEGQSFIAIHAPISQGFGSGITAIYVRLSDLPVHEQRESSEDVMLHPETHC